MLKAFAVHGGENPPMDRLQAVSGIGKRASDDDGHGVGQIRAAHLLFDIHWEEDRAVVRGGAAIKRKLGVLIVGHMVFSCLRKCGVGGPEKAGPESVGDRSILALLRGFRQASEL